MLPTLDAARVAKAFDPSARGLHPNTFGGPALLADVFGPALGVANHSIDSLAVAGIRVEVKSELAKLLLDLNGLEPIALRKFLQIPAERSDKVLPATCNRDPCLAQKRGKVVSKPLYMASIGHF